MRTAFYIHWIWYTATIYLMVHFKDVQLDIWLAVSAVISCYLSLLFICVSPFINKYLSDEDTNDRFLKGIIATILTRGVIDIVTIIGINVFGILEFPDKYIILAIGMIAIGAAVAFDIKRKLNDIERTLL